MSQPVDTRPFWAILLSKIYRPAVFAFVIILFLFIIKMPTPDGLTEEGQRAIAVFSVCLILWVTSLIPLQITSLLAIILLPLMGIIESKKAYSLFGNEAVFFILGAFILAAAMMFPIILQIAKSLELSPIESRYGKALFLAPTWGVIIGGVGTFLGGARNPLAVGILMETTGNSIGFFEWMVAVVPAVIIMLAVGYFVLFRFFRIDLKNVRQVEEALVHRKIAKGRITCEERLIGVI